MSQSDQQASAASGAPVLIPAGKTFTPDEITFFTDKGTRTLEQAIAEADLLVSCPHSGDAVPEELAEFLAPEFTHRLQFDYSDRTTGPVLRAWAQVDPRIIYVENPHPRLLRDPNRPRPANLGAQLREAFNRVRDAGAWNKVDLTGVDTIRPVTFSFFPLLRVPDSDAELEAMVQAFESVAERGLGVYESTRNSIRNAMVAAASERVKNGGRAQVTTLSFHDTMNHTTTRDGAVNVLRAPADQLPDVVALSNRGDAQGNRRGEDVITMEAEALRALADCHRTGFDVAFDADVALNTPYLGSQEIIASGERFRNLTDSSFTLESGSGTVQLGAVQAEFLREYLLGPTATAALQLPGTGWPNEDTEWTATLARHCMASWNEFRAWFATQEPETEPA